ncbi:MAG: hypothetical protein NTZ13_02745 [Candidatus Parcubacteria bacterium]|nr:hypothetical protein [Candidatus Parcubacteria bacterium]
MRIKLSTPSWMERINYSWRNIISGIFIYAIGDTIATLINGNISMSRILGMAILGGTIYALEVPNWFLLIDKWTKRYEPGFKKIAARTALAMGYFNPLWIARHLLFINLFTGQWASVSWALLPIAGMSFLTNIPLSILGNYVIQNKVPLEWRYIASSIFSSLMAIMYAMGAVWFK